MDPQTTINGAVNDCLDLFEKLIDSTGTQSDALPGGFPTRAQLNRVFLDKPKTSIIVVQLLYLMTQTLEQNSAPNAKASDTRISQLVNESDNESVNVNAVKEAIKRLFSLSRHITSPTVTVSGEDLDFELNMVRLLRREFEAAPKTLLEQLASTIACRKQRLSHELHNIAKLEWIKSSNLIDTSCPFCDMSLDDPAGSYDDHIKMPYVCISEDCSPSHQFFAHFQAWIDHMNTLHSEEWARRIHSTTWICDIEHPRADFGDQESFEAHMSETALHPRRGRPTDRQLATLSRNKKKMVPREPLFCPLCGCIPPEVQQVVDGPSAPQIHSTLFKHIGEHLRSLAQLSHHLLQPEYSQTDLRGEGRLAVSLCSPNADDSTDYIDRRFALTNEEPIISFDDPPSADQNFTQDQNIPDVAVDETAHLWSDVWSHKPKSMKTNVVENIGKHREQSLRTKIARAQIKSALDDRKFVPTDLIQQLITPDAVRHELSLVDIAANNDELSQYILLRARKVFAILVYIGKVSCVKDFFLNGFSDDCLPLSLEELDCECRLMSPLEVKKTAIMAATWETFASWSYPDAELFYNSQWAFLAPVFTADRFEYVVPNQCPLPFTWINRNSKKTGLFSIVQEAAIQSGHLHIPFVDQTPVTTVAIKELLQDRDNFERELKAAEITSTLDHPHFIRALAACIRNEKQFFLFPWAGGGNLRETWRDLDHTRVNESTGLHYWVLHELLGLSEGLEKLHSMNCRHGDLKPENILRFHEGRVFKRWGTLAIADMGIAKVHHASTAERSRGTATTAGTQKYEHPEAMLDSSSPTSRRADTWSFGCIMVELLVWLLYGYDELERFDGAFTRYFDIGDGKIVVNPVVVHWMKCVEHDPRCQKGTAFRDVLELAQQRLLVPEQPIGQEAGGGAPVKGRADAIELHYSLREIMESRKE